ncbi:hypothetical protein EVAR_100863_1, partial [Eumeta japonica]
AKVMFADVNYSTGMLQQASTVSHIENLGRDRIGRRIAFESQDAGRFYYYSNKKYWSRVYCDNQYLSP